VKSDLSTGRVSNVWGEGDKGPQTLLWAGSSAALVKVAISNIPKSLCNFCTLYKIYKCGRGPHNATWRAAGSVPLV
jgi:hypothetical protein